MPDRILGKHPRFAAYLILFLSLVVFGLTVWIYSLNGRVSDGEALRRSEAKAQVARKASERRAAKARAQSECRSSIKGAKQGRQIIEDLRATYLELAANTINPDAAVILRRRAKHLPMFPTPKCNPGSKGTP